MSYTTKVSTCSLNQHALAFSLNLANLKAAVDAAKADNSKYLLTPELSLCGYGCEDHFLEPDTESHCWEILAELLPSTLNCPNFLLDVGMPIVFNGSRFNCRVLVCDGRIVGIRPKTVMADDGNYREGRWFTPWCRGVGELEEYLLPKAFIDSVPGSSQRTTPFGLMVFRTSDGLKLSVETCEELWSPESPNIELSLLGVEVIANGSGSHHELRKLHRRLELIIEATKKNGGVYLYSNQRGCDGSRVYYDGSSMIVCNGQVLRQGVQFGLKDVEVLTATVDVEGVRSYRACRPSFRMQSASHSCPREQVNLESMRAFLPAASARRDLKPTDPVELTFSTPEQECLLGPACWLWDYLRRSGGSGFFLPLSGGADSASTATIVFAMCKLVMKEFLAGDNEQLRRDVVKVVGEGAVVRTAEELCNLILHTTYMGTSNSSQQTLRRAGVLASHIGCYHLSANIDAMVSSVVGVFTTITNCRPSFESAGGTSVEDLALQNIQARLRMVLAYMMAQLLPWCRKRKGFLLVLGSGNVDECLRGYLTKYDCSSADLNPIGSISKVDLKNMLKFAAVEYNLAILAEIVAAPPTAELRPNGAKEEHTQSDEADMGMSYEELGVFGRLRKISRCGPVSMYRKLLHIWPELTAQQVADKVKRFFFYYSINRHKMTTITPSYHAEAYSPDDNRFDQRPFLYDARWSWQNKVMDTLASEDQQGLC